MNLIVSLSKEEKVPHFIGRLFYLYYSLLALLSFIALYFEKDMWKIFTGYIPVENGTGYFLYHAFCAVTFFVSAILPLVIVQSTPLPKNRWITLAMIFDAPLLILIDYLTGRQISFAEILMYDFVVEMLAFCIADIFIRIIRKEDHVAHLIIDIYSIALVFSFYGIYSLGLLIAAGIKSWIIALFTICTAAYSYYNVLKSGGVGLSGDNDVVQVQMSQVGTLAMLLLWLLLAFVYVKALMF